MRKKSTLRILSLALFCGLAGTLLLGGTADAAIVINEVLGSTTGADTEYIELYNTGPAPVDISNWEIELWDSDAGGTFGGADGGSPFVIPAATNLNVGNYYLIANAAAEAAFSVTADLLLAGSIENSSYTIVLADGTGGTVIDSVFVTDGGAGDEPNRAGVIPFVPGASIGPDGPNLPAGFYRVGDGGATLALLEFSPVPAPSGTPGSANPGAAATGACCNGAVCTPDVAELDCTNGGGEWQGTDSLCTPNPCGPVGACCSTDFSTCTNNLTVEECTALDPTATWLQDEFCNLACGPTGSCCLSLTGTCATGVTEAECAAMQGYQWTEGANDCTPTCVAGQQEAILISEYYESAPGALKAIELHNPGPTAANLNGHALLVHFNLCSGSPGTVLLDGLSIPANDTLVIINNSTDDIPGFDESQAHTDGSLNFNGDDAVELVFGDVTGVPTIIDAFAVACQQDTGPRGLDPYQDSAWERDCAITTGTASFDPCNFDGLKDCALAECPSGTPVGPPTCNDGTDPPEAGQWIFEGLNPSGDSDQHSLGSHLCLPGGGACCLPNDDCVITDLAGCNGLSGTFFAGTPCNPDPCGTTGSCCLTNVFCQTGVTASQCAALDANAFFTPAGDCSTECPNTGACCLGAPAPEGGCATCPGDVNGDASVNVGDLGLWVAELLGPGSNPCAEINGIPPLDGLDIQPFIELVMGPTSCAGCIVTTAANCASLTGSYIGDGVPCDPDPCGPLGMCCSQDLATCVDNLSQGQCTALDPTASHVPGQTCAVDCVPVVTGGLVINEFWADDGFDDDVEFIEVFCNACAASQSLDGLSVIVVDGDTAGDTGAFQYRRVSLQVDLTGFALSAGEFLLIGTDNINAITGQTVDISISAGALQNGSQTYALVRTQDIEYEAAPDDDKLTAASEAAITANLIDGIATTDDADDLPTPGLDHRYFGSPVIETDFGVDTASRIPNGQDTDAGENPGGDWTQQDNFPAPGTELFDANDRLSSPGTTNSEDPLGTCCTATVCSGPVSVSACEGGGGMWIGRLVDCSDPNANPCLPLGACCIDATTCVIANQAACIVTLGGNYEGDATVCDPLPCGPTGSCCAADFQTCTDDLTVEECMALDATATWTNGGTCAANCIAPEGACCVSNVCDDTPPVTAAACLAMDGFYLGDGSTCAMSQCPSRPCLIISEVVDGDRAGGNPKFVEITNTDVNDYTFAAGGVIVQSNAATDTTVDVDLTGVTIFAGQSFVIQSTGNGGQAVFEDTYDVTFPGGPIVADLYTPAFFSNGDDRYAITDAVDGSNILDIHGEFGVDGTGTAWEYLNSYAFRNPGANSGNLGTFFISEWTHGGVGALVGADDATDKLLLQQNTTPTTHNYAGGCSGGGGGPEDFSIIRCDESGDDSCPQAGTNHCLFQLPGNPPVGMPACDMTGINLICIECDAGVCIDDSFALLEFRWVDGEGVGMDCFFTASVVATNCNLCSVGIPRFRLAP